MKTPARRDALRRSWNPGGHALARCLALCAFLLGGLAASNLQAVTRTQQLALQPGWNSVFVEVAPANPDPTTVFAGLPVDQVWSYFPTRSPVQYLSNPSEGLFNVPGWNVWLPPTARPDAALLTDLKAVIGHQAYLVHTTAAATLNVTGEATIQPIKWNPDSFTLTGLPVDPSTTVRAGDFFASSPAHAGQGRYRLDASGVWQAVADGAALAAGQAYWVFTKGGSDFLAPLDVSFGGGRTLDFGPGQESIKLTVRNRSAYAANISLANPNGFPLSIQQPGGSQSKTVPANSSAVLTLGVRRAGLASATTGFLQVSGGGVALNVPLAVSLPTSSAGTSVPSLAKGKRSGSRASDASATDDPNAGLWVGSATLNAVSEANSATPTVLTATPATFALRLIVHVNKNGTARLLKEVTMMKTKGGVSGDPTNPPALVLVSDPAQLVNFDAPETRDGSPFAHRLTSVGFDFAGDRVALAGAFGSTLTGTVTMDRLLSTNPFLHRYHPDHDGLTPQQVDQATLTPALPVDQQEVWGVQRAVKLVFDAASTSSADPSTGYSQRTGVYAETLGGVNANTPGLHKNPIYVSGTFTLRRLNNIGLLNNVTE